MAVTVVAAVQVTAAETAVAETLAMVAETGVVLAMAAAPGSVVVAGRGCHPAWRSALFCRQGWLKWNSSRLGLPNSTRHRPAWRKCRDRRRACRIDYKPDGGRAAWPGAVTER